jgi:uncharacterized protein YwgA
MIQIHDNAAYIIKRINAIQNNKPGKKALQKLVFLIEQKGIPLKYEYGLHFYGPYSGRLDAATAFLSADGIVKFDYSGYSHKMSIDEKYNVEPQSLSKQHVAVIDDLIEHFNGWSASDLELLTTAIYAYNNLEDKSMQSTINGVKKIKGSKYSTDEITRIFSEFSYFGKPI